MFHFVDCVHYDVLLSEQDNKKYVSIVDTKVQTRNVHNKYMSKHLGIPMQKLCASEVCCTQILLSVHSQQYFL